MKIHQAMSPWRLCGLWVLAIAAAAPAATAGGHPWNQPAPYDLTQDQVIALRRVVLHHWIRPENPEKVRHAASTLRPDGHWDDLDYEDQTPLGWDVAYKHLGRMTVMTRGFAAPDGPLYHDPTLRQDILRALDFWIKKDPRNPNWWWPQVGVPERLAPVAVIMKPYMTPAQIEGASRILSRCKVKQREQWMGGGNLLYDCTTALWYGLFLEDGHLLGRLYHEQLPRAFELNPGGSGVQPDWSEWEHGHQLYNHGYGQELLVRATTFLRYAGQAGIPGNPEDLDFLQNYLLKGSQWMARGKYLDYPPRGREIAGKYSKAEAEEPQNAPWPTKPNYLAKVAHNLILARATDKKQLQAIIDRQHDGEPLLIGNRMFYDSDYMVHHRKAFFASVKMHSTRVVNSEVVKGQNLLAQHIGQGSMYIILHGNEYHRIFGAWNWNRIPGTTANQRSITGFKAGEVSHLNEIPKSALDKEKLKHHIVALRVAHLGRSPFVGGASNGYIGAAVMVQHVLNLRARKAWFFIGKGFVCLGNSICDEDPGHVVTTINQCLLDGPVRVAGSDGRVRTLPKETSQAIAHASLVYHDQVAYLFPRSQALVCANKTRTGDWRRANRESAATPVHKRIFSLWIDHGVKPKQASYAYQVAPGVSLAEAKKIAEHDPIEILANGDIQAVRDRETGAVEAVFHKPGQLDLGGGHVLTVSDGCILVLSPKNHTLSIADPQHEKKTIIVTLNGATYHITVVDGVTTTVKLR